MSAELAAAQRALVSALTGAGRIPNGFDTDRVLAARAAMLRKRMASVRRWWPRLVVALGAVFAAQFEYWATSNPVRGGLLDGLEFAKALKAAGTLPPAGLRLLAEWEVRWRVDAGHRVRRRRMPALRVAAGTVFLGVGDRVFMVSYRRRS